MIFWWASLAGPKAPPGDYMVELEIGDQVFAQEFKIYGDPRNPSTQEDMEEQFSFLMKINKKVTESHEAIIEMRDIREQLNNYKDRIKDNEELKEVVKIAEQIDSTMTKIEEQLYQTKNRARQDPLNFPVRLTNKLAHLNSLTTGDYPPTKQAKELRESLTKAIDEQLDQFKKLKADELPKFNEAVKKQAVDAVILKDKKKISG